MADFSALLTSETTFFGKVGNGGVGVLVPVVTLFGESPGVVAPTKYLQRLWDTGLGAYVYFTRESTDPTTPALATGDTQPTNTGAFDFANHALLAEI